MNLNDDRQRRVLFAGMAAVLVLLGLWLWWPRPDTEPVERDGAPVASAPPAAPATPPPGIDELVDPESFDVYRLLPFGREDFATAATTAQQFVSRYGTYRYDETPQTYLDRLRPLVNDQVHDDLLAAASSPGILEQRKADRTVAEGSASLNSIRTIGGTSITFVVTGIQQVTEAGTTGQDSEQWAVTVQNTGGSWKVYSFGPADVGQDGESG
ncbi:hypothetical protein [Actinocorallia populi]|uniref:hypothetical protein n=1 Tax=Actinocorallia populi TaxID=2079200 RepID=UPI000D086CCC|nr:hypothetical protein [Actinocorallia populi]